MSEPRPLTLKKMPKSIRDLILDEQTEIKKKCNCMFSQENTIYHMLKEWAISKGKTIVEDDEPEVTIED